ncbi:MAG: hypothetical protein ACREMY_09615 [bacterium]
MMMVRSGAIALPAIAAAMVLAGCTDETTGSEETLTLTESNKGSHFAPIGEAIAAHDPPGTGFAISIPLQDSSKQTVGEINAVCIATKPSPEPVLYGTCSGTADVPEGQLGITQGGTIGDNTSGAPGAIVGGTGKYEGATGRFTSKLSGERIQDTFNITLP